MLTINPTVLSPLPQSTITSYSCGYCDKRHRSVAFAMSCQIANRAINKVAEPKNVEQTARNIAMVISHINGNANHVTAKNNNISTDRVSQIVRRTLTRVRGQASHQT